MQELKDLCKASTPEVINQVLPVWARIYCILAIDVEHRVREAVQEVHRLIVNSVGRNLAPYLKQIAPLWFISQYDTYAPAASIATNAFQVNLHLEISENKNSLINCLFNIFKINLFNQPCK